MAASQDTLLLGFLTTLPHFQIAQSPAASIRLRQGCARRRVAVGELRTFRKTCQPGREAVVRGGRAER